PGAAAARRRVVADADHERGGRRAAGGRALGDRGGRDPRADVRGRPELATPLPGRRGVIGAATMLEASGGKGSWLGGLRAISAPAALAGPAFTVSAPPRDNLALHRAIAACPSGAVLVVSTGGTTDTAVFGDVLAVAAQERGVAGVVTDGAVRDVGSL